MPYTRQPHPARPAGLPAVLDRAGPGDDQVVAVAGGPRPVGVFTVAIPEWAGIGSIRTRKGR